MRVVRQLFSTMVVATLLVGAGGVTSSIAQTRQAIVTDLGPSEPGTGNSANQLGAGDRERLIGPKWADDADTAITAVGSATGFSILKAVAADGYKWSTLAELSIPGVETDKWVGNYCLTQDGAQLAVVFAPRAYSNSERLTAQGAFGAIVDVQSGLVTGLGRGYTLAYFNPGCGESNAVALTRFSEGKTYIGLLNASTAKPIRTMSAAGQFTSSIPGPENTIISASPAGVLRMNDDGTSIVLAKSTGVPYGFQLGAAGKLTYLEHTSKTATAKLLDLAKGGSAESSVLATGPVTKMGTARDATGRVFILGEPGTVARGLGKTHVVVNTDVNATISSHGELAVQTPEPDRSALGAYEVPTRFVSSGESRTFGVTPVDPGTSSEIRLPSGHGMGISRGAVITGSASYPGEAERTCAVSRNDPHSQVIQPKPRQVEWAVDRAIAGQLTIQRPANWNNLGMAAYTPQGMFPKGALSGGGRIPAQVLLGVLAQESNLTQASPLANPGETGNPLVGRYYGTDASSTFEDSAFWNINFAAADCGYGVAQITDGMRVGDLTLTASQQRAIALDYTANIARAVQMLQDKWNETRGAGVTINNGDSARIENWYAAVWAYNSGFHENLGSYWGLGWFNNPMNAIYSPSRESFLDNHHVSDASHPQDWTYPEKVMGFAANSLFLPETAVSTKASATGVSVTTVAAFRTAWWAGGGTADSEGTTGAENRTASQAPRETFCSLSVNSCDPSATPGAEACTITGLYCWWHGNATWKANCDFSCGYETYRFSPDASYMDEQANGASFPPNCGTTGLPSGALVIDDLPLIADGSTIVQAPVRPGCTAVATHGTFAFDFGAPLLNGSYPSKIDLHQLGSGFNAHFYFTHSRKAGVLPSSRITGTWTLGQSLNSWARVLVHMPDHAAWSQQAAYTVHRGDGSSETRTLAQRTAANTWVPLGVFHMAGTPSVSLSNSTYDGVAVDDIAWDAVAIQPLSQKPLDFVVSLGDSYSSGEGASDLDGPAWSYSFSSDNNGSSSQFRNACHRSSEAWSRKAKLSTAPTISIGQRADALDAGLDYHLLACSGATVDNVSPDGAAKDKGQYHELTQLDQGYLDSNTTLVTLSIGGNDIGFSDVVQSCVGGFCGYTVAQLTDRIDNVMAPAITDLLGEIHTEAPNATILLMGYPKLFEGSGGCLAIGLNALPTLNSVSDALTAKLADIANDFSNTTGATTVFGNPVSGFTGRELCQPNSAINALVLTKSPGESPSGAPWPNQTGISQQSVHPNSGGTDLYGSVMTDALAGIY